MVREITFNSKYNVVVKKKALFRVAAQPLYNAQIYIEFFEDDDCGGHYIEVPEKVNTNDLEEFSKELEKLSAAYKAKMEEIMAKALELKKQGFIVALDEDPYGGDC